MLARMCLQILSGQTLLWHLCPGRTGVNRWAEHTGPAGIDTLRAPRDRPAYSIELPRQSESFAITLGRSRHFVGLGVTVDREISPGRLLFAEPAVLEVTSPSGELDPDLSALWSQFSELPGEIQVPKSES